MYVLNSCTSLFLFQEIALVNSAREGIVLLQERKDLQTESKDEVFSFMDCSIRKEGKKWDEKYTTCFYVWFYEEEIFVLAQLTI